MAGHGARVPRLLAGVDIQKLPLSPLEGFVLSRIDGRAPVSLLADLTNLGLQEVDAIVERLIALGAAEWARESVSLPRSTGREGLGTPPVVTVPPALRSRSPIRVRTSEPARREVKAAGAYKARGAVTDEVDPARRSIRPGATPLASHTGALEPAGDIEEIEVPAEERELDIDPERRRRIDELYERIGELDHYEALGIARTATRAEVRHAYFSLSKLVHPDTMFRKRLGPYKAKMEAIFKRLTEAYDVLGKKKARQEYDRYLELREQTEGAEAGLVSTPAPDPLTEAQHSSSGPKSASTSAPASESIPEPASEARRAASASQKSEPASSPKPTIPTPRLSPEAKARARARMAAQVRSAVAQVSRVRSSTPPPAPSAEPAPLGREGVLRSLTSSLKESAAHTGGLQGVQRHIRNARRAEEQGELAEAARELRLALAIEPGRPDLVSEYARVKGILAAALAPTYEERARYEQLHGKWAAAALSWAKVFEGRPYDASAATKAAEALVEAKGDLHRAKALAQRAVELSPDDARAHRALGRVYAEAGLILSARRALERAAALDPNDPLVDALLRSLPARA